MQTTIFLMLHGHWLMWPAACVMSSFAATSTIHKSSVDNDGANTKPHYVDDFGYELSLPVYLDCVCKTRCTGRRQYAMRRKIAVDGSKKQPQLTLSLCAEAVA